MRMQLTTNQFIGAFWLLHTQHAHAELPRGLPHEVLNVTTVRPVTLTGNVTIIESCPLPTGFAERTTTIESCVASAQTETIHSVIYPSPDALPIEITSQSQIITSYIPEMTWCVPPAIALSPLPMPPWADGSNETTSYTQITSGTGSCSTAFTPIQTTICATTLTGLASKITVTDCDQEITFSTECGFTLKIPTPVTASLATITPGPVVKRMSTYWLAPWQALTAGETPSDVDVKICTVLEDGDLECERYREVWEVIVVTSTITTSRTIQISTTVSGPGTLVIDTLQSVVTGAVETIDLSTILRLETETEVEVTSKATPTTTVRRTSAYTITVFITRHVRRKSSSTLQLPSTDADQGFKAAANSLPAQTSVSGAFVPASPEETLRPIMTSQSQIEESLPSIAVSGDAVESSVPVALVSQQDLSVLVSSSPSQYPSQLQSNSTLSTKVPGLAAGNAPERFAYFDFAAHRGSSSYTNATTTVWITSTTIQVIAGTTTLTKQRMRPQQIR